MQNNKMSKVVLNRTGTGSNRFNLSHDNATTFSFGDIQPVLLKLMEPNSKCTLDASTVTRYSPMIVPTLGRMKQKIWSMFIPMDQVYPNYDFMMAQTAVHRNNGTWVPDELPNISLRQLTMLAIIGSQLTIWKKERGTVQEVWRHYPEYTSGSGQLIYNFITTPDRIAESRSLPDFNYSGPAFNLGWLEKSYFGGSDPSSSTSTSEIYVPFGMTPSAVVEEIETHVLLDKADLCLITDPIKLGNSDSTEYAFAFRCSAWGKRWLKILRGLGYQPSLRSNVQVDFTRLLAWYRGYYELFGLNLYSNFEQTACFGLIQYISQMFVTNFNDHGTGASSLWDRTDSLLWKFLLECNDCFVTEPADYVSAHIAYAGTATSLVGGTGKTMLDNQLSFANSGSFIDTNVATSLFNDRDATTANSGGLVYDKFAHGALDEKLLKLFYRWTNKQSVLGSDIANLLREFGYGEYIDEVKIDFIGYNEHWLDVSDVTAVANTYSSVDKSGSPLGEIAGKVVQSNKSKTFSYETKKKGYWITYAAICPESGYCQGYDHSVKAIKFFDQYNADLDGLGYEATPKAELVGYGSVFAPESSDGNGDTATFGFIPRFTGLKVHPNKINGDFALNSTKAGYLPFILDKVLPVNERALLSYNQLSGGITECKWVPQMNFNNMPIAGNIWRYLFRYGWCGNLNRIFVEDNDLQVIIDKVASRLCDSSIYDFGLNGNRAYEFVHEDYDNILSDFIFNFQYYAHMLSTGESYETFDETAPANSTVEKA